MGGSLDKDKGPAGEKPAGADASRGSSLDRRQFLAVLGGGVACVAGVAALGAFVLPGTGAADPSKLYDYVYAAGKSENLDFVLNNMSADGRLCFGSSEFYISKDLVPMCPQAVFGESCSGVDMTYLGEGYDQSLWQAIAAGAYAGDSRLAHREVMLVASPQWFFKNAGDQSKFYTKFSYTLYRAFMANPQLSDETRAYVRSRCSALGIDGTTLAAGARDSVVDAVNDAGYALDDGWRLRADIPNIVRLAPSKSAARNAGQPTGEPDWDALLASAVQEGDARCTNNDFGIYDAFWEKNHTFDPELFQNLHQADAEYEDLAAFLVVCSECGLRPLVCMLPMHGAWYDISDVGADERAAYYERVRSICDDAGAAYADFSSCEYEKYFLCDTVHPGWVGWVRIEHAFYDFIMGRDNDFLGGAGYGAARGLNAAQTGDGA